MQQTPTSTTLNAKERKKMKIDMLPGSLALSPTSTCSGIRFFVMHSARMLSKP
jgi:hypothetical protein